jgi:hypothetical protein
VKRQATRFRRVHVGPRHPQPGDEGVFPAVFERDIEHVPGPLRALNASRPRLTAADTGGDVGGDERFARGRFAFDQGQLADRNISWPEPLDRLFVHSQAEEGLDEARFDDVDVAVRDAVDALLGDLRPRNRRPAERRQLRLAPFVGFLRAVTDLRFDRPRNVARRRGFLRWGRFVGFVRFVGFLRFERFLGFVLLRFVSHEFCSCESDMNAIR